MMYLMLIAGFVFLLGGADVFVRGAVAIAARLNVSPLVIGLTVVAFGTSAPELLVSLNAALAGAGNMALGNVVGSNIANLLLIVGAAALVKPIMVKPFALMRDTVMLIGSSLLFAWFCWRGEIGPWQGTVLLVALFVFLGNSYRREVSGDDPEAADIHIQEIEEYKGLRGSTWVLWMTLLAGLAGLVFGADLLVKGGVSIAREFGIAEEVIGLTVLAIGTSLPELAASVVAALRGHSDVAIGNVVGSNMFNVLAVVGVVSMVTPLNAPAQLVQFDLWVMLAVTLIMVPYLLGRMRLGRAASALFLTAYAGYIMIQAYGVSGVLALVG